MSRVLGVDLGTVRIGIALSDPTGAVASPLDTIIHRDRRKDLAAVAAVARAHRVERIVVGWPRNMDGTAGPAAKRAEAFADSLRQMVDVPVDLWDERLSTVAAERILRDANVRRERRSSIRDRVAAAIILQAYLAVRPGGNDEVPASRGDRSSEEL